MKRLVFAALSFWIAALGSVAAQPACPSGQALKQQALAAEQRFNQVAPNVKFGEVPSKDSREARAYYYLTFASFADDKAVEQLVYHFTSYAWKCHPDDCPAGIPLTASERSEIRAYISAALKASQNKTARPPLPGVYRELPTAERIKWAEGVLGCSYKGRGSIMAEKPPAPVQSYTPPRTTSSSSSSSGSSSPSYSPAPAAPVQRVVKVYGDWAYGSGYYCTNNEYQTDGYAKANARKACTDQGGYDGGTYITQSGYNGYRPNAEQCYQAKAYTECVFDD